MTSYHIKLWVHANNLTKMISYFHVSVFREEEGGMLPLEAVDKCKSSDTDNVT